MVDNMQLTLIKRNFKWLALIGCCWLLFGAPQAGAQSIDQLVQQAEFIFEGKVIDVQYQFSQKSTGEPSGVPYTFVTYQIYGIQKGNYGAGTITLRFIGGADANGVVFSMEGTPRFDLDDHDVLLVDKNGYELCPLVNCAQGRFRYINGLVVNEYGQLIELRNGQLQLGQMVDLDDVTTHKMGDMTLTRREMKNVDGEDVPVAVPKAKASTGFMPDTAGFTSYIQEKVYANHDASELAAMSPYKTVDPKAAFTDELLERIYTPGEEPESMREPEHKKVAAKKSAPAPVMIESEKLSSNLKKTTQYEQNIAEVTEVSDAKLVSDMSWPWHIFILIIVAVLLFFILTRRVR